MAGEAGKGSSRRPSEVSKEVADANWERIFGKKNTNIDAEIQRHSEPVPSRDYANNWTGTAEPVKAHPIHALDPLLVYCNG